MTATDAPAATSESEELPIYGRYGRVALIVTLALLAAGMLLLLLYFVAIQ